MHCLSKTTLAAAVLLLAASSQAFSPTLHTQTPPLTFTAHRSLLFPPAHRSLLFAATEEAIAAVDDLEAIDMKLKVNGTSYDMPMPDLMEALEVETEMAVNEMIDETCEIDYEIGGGQPLDPECADEELKRGFKTKLKGVMKHTLNLVRLGEDDSKEMDEDEEEALKEDLEDDTGFIARFKMFSRGRKPAAPVQAKPLTGDELEQGWERRGNASALRRNTEVWKFALKCVFKVVKARKLAKQEGISETELDEAKTAAALYIRNGLLELGPTFVKLGQVVSTRTDVLPKEFTNVLNTLQDQVPGFSGVKAKEIVSTELGRPFDEVFTDFSPTPLKAASLGQVHTAVYKGQKVAIKVQRAGLKELFNVDLKNLKKLAELLDKFDPKTDGADRDWVGIYEESERLLYLEIDYLHEADNCERFAEDFKNVPHVRVPKIIKEVTTPRVLTMEFVESFKLTDVERIDQLGLNRQVLARHTADAFLRQIIETGYFHADPRT
jgi:hypothetical protein